MISTEILWQVKTSKPFNIVAYGRVFQESIESIVTGGEEGIVHVYEIPDKKAFSAKIVRSLETKCGPIFHLHLHDVIRLVSQDIITADSRGAVTIFCNGQIFMRNMPEKASAITALQIHETPLGHLYIIIGDDSGILKCFNAFNNLWKIKLGDALVGKTDNISNNLSITCILATPISSSTCPAMDYFVVADSNHNLHFINTDGSVLLTIETPAVVTAMTTGNFLHFDDSSEGNEKLTQIALGCADGSVWVCVDFEVQTAARYHDIGHPITNLHRLPSLQQSRISNSRGTNGEIMRQMTNFSSTKLDLLLCTGHFPAIIILREGKMMTKHPLSDWAISICEFGNNQSDEECNTVLVGCRDSTLSAIRVT